MVALIPCDEVSWCEVETAGGGRPIQQTVVDGIRLAVHRVDDAPSYLDLSPGFLGCIDRGGAARDGRRWSDPYTPTELRGDPCYAEEVRRAGFSYGLVVELPAVPGRTRRLMLCREHVPDFSRRDVQLMELLRPHIFEAYQLARRRRAGTPKQTPREWQVLELAAHGYPNAEIAGLLRTSVATVRKHMEHIFDRTGLRTRSAVVAELMLGPDLPS